MPRVLALAAALAGLAACTPSFESVTDVTDLRVLGIAAEPPEAFVDLQAGSVQAVRVRILVANGKPRGLVTIRPALCFPTGDRICDGPRLELPEVRGEYGDISFEVQPTPALAQLIVGALQDDRLKGFGGIRVQMTAEVEDGDPNGPVRASKILLFSAQPPERANHQPRIAKLQVIRGDGTEEELLAGKMLHLQRFEEVGIRPLLAPGPEGAETYTTTDLSGREVTLTEQPAYNFFAVLGVEWDRARAYEPLPTQPTPTFGIARLRPYISGRGNFWIVVRDGRGGESWFVGEFLVP